MSKKPQVDWGAHLDNVFGNIPSSITTTPENTPPFPIAPSITPHIAPSNIQSDSVLNSSSDSSIDRQPDILIIKQIDSLLIEQTDSLHDTAIDLSINKYINSPLDSEISIKPTISTAKSPTKSSTDRPSINRSIKPSIRPLPAKSAAQETIDDTEGQTIYNTPYQTLSETGYNIVDVLTPMQAKVLSYLIDNTNGLTSATLISNATEVGVATIRNILQCLARDGFISKPNAFRSKRFQGFTYRINKVLCDEFKEHLNASGGVYQTVYKTPYQAIYKPPSDTVSESDHISDNLPNPLTIKPLSRLSDTSSSSENQGTTTATVLTGPEMAYWVEQGLKDRQVMKWCEEFDIKPEEMRQQLAWSRWDLVNNGKEAEVKKDVINWFYGVLKRSAGCYPLPKDYQSPIQIRARMLKNQLEAENQARAELVTLEAEARFQAVLVDPEGKEYQRLLSSLPEMMRDMKGRALESVLRERFFATGE